jgi:hypothetical protein
MSSTPRFTSRVAGPAAGVRKQGAQRERIFMRGVSVVFERCPTCEGGKDSKKAERL